MNKFFQIMGILTLIFFSFFYTQKTSNVVKEYDLIMKQIKQIAPLKKQEAINATINDNKIIPGKKGKVVNINKSYYKMKQYGEYEESLLVYQELKPKISYYDYLDKYVIKGNEQEKNIGLLVLVEDLTYLSSFLNIIKENQIKVSFFVERELVEQDSNLIINILATGNQLGSLDFNTKYQIKDFSWMNVLIKKRQGFNECYTDKEDEEILQNCANNKNSTILPKHYLDNNNLKKIKNNLQNGDIIAIAMNSQTETVLASLIQFIKSKGYEIKPVHDLLKE